MTTAASPEIRLSTQRLFGDTRRWRRFGTPVAAGTSTLPDGTPDHGLFGPGSVAWEVLLHPATIVFETAAQGIAQLLYKPIAAGIRDRDPISRKGRAGTLTFFDSFERFQRNSGMHAPMWFGDSATAASMAKHLRAIHRRVVGDVIDVGAPELGSYDASGPRDAMWAALTELHPVLRFYEAFAFRGAALPRRLPPALRDRFIAEVAEYVRLVAPDSEEIPTSTAALAALYERYAPLFEHSTTMNLLPETGEDYQAIMGKAMTRNFHPTQLKAALPMLLLIKGFELPVMGALSARARRAAGYGATRSTLALAARWLALPAIWVMQQPPVERLFMRLMWGPDGVELITHARRLHGEVVARRRAVVAR